MKFPGFCGSSDPHRSTNVNAERTLNLYLEHASGLPKADPIDIKCPGLAPWIVFETFPIRALFYQDGRCFAIAGTVLEEIFVDISPPHAVTAIARGTVIDDGRPAYICSNGRPGHQLLIISGNQGLIFDLNANTLTLIVDPNFPANVIQADFIDGYFVALDNSTNTFYLSDLLDGLSWNGTMVAQRNLASDELSGMIVNHRELWLLGTQRTEVWYNSGATFPLQPILSAGVIEQGCLAPFSLTRVGDTIAWLGADERGGVAVYRANGYRAERISTAAMEAVVSHYTDLRLSIGWAYLEDGHQFYALYVPGKPAAGSGIDWTTWVYDFTLNAWHERATWNTAIAEWEPHVGRCHCYDWFTQTHLVGDRQSGAVYRMSLDLYDEDLTVPV